MLTLNAVLPELQYTAQINVYTVDSARCTISFAYGPKHFTNVISLRFCDAAVPKKILNIYLVSV
jgi:hypothetical protein